MLEPAQRRSNGLLISSAAPQLHLNDCCCSWRRRRNRPSVLCRFESAAPAAPVVVCSDRAPSSTPSTLRSCPSLKINACERLMEEWPEKSGEIAGRANGRMFAHSSATLFLTRPFINARTLQKELRRTAAGGREGGIVSIGRTIRSGVRNRANCPTTVRERREEWRGQENGHSSNLDGAFFGVVESDDGCVRVTVDGPSVSQSCATFSPTNAPPRSP